MTHQRNLFFILKTALRFTSMHAIILVLILGIFYGVIGIPLYHTYDSGLKGVEIYFLYLIYAVSVFPINILMLHNNMKKVQHNKSIYKIKIYTAYILLFPALSVVIYSLLFSIL